jgi:hypothetical protein
MIRKMGTGFPKRIMPKQGGEPTCLEIPWWLSVTGAVGAQFIATLNKRAFPVGKLKALASRRRDINAVRHW